MPRIPPAQKAHRDWLALIRPTGLVVAAPALARAAGALPRDPEGQRRLRAWRDDFEGGTGTNPRAAFRKFASSVLDWDFSPRWYADANSDGVPPVPTAALPEYGETLAADFAVREPDAPPTADGEGDPPPWQLAVSTHRPQQDLDTRIPGGGRLDASPNHRMERLLRKRRIPAGVLFNGRRIRLVSAPHGESSGFMDFVVDEMAETAGRPLLAALRLLLRQPRLLSLPANERLPALLGNSRRYQNEVSERLAGQVLGGLYDLLRGIQAADTARGGALLRDPLRDAPDEIYRALLTVILRLVFLLYAEQRGLLPDDDPTYARHYALMALFERLRADEAFHPDTMHQRHGAWAHLLALTRMIHDGARSGAMRLPPRQGDLFDPGRYPFLEGRIAAGGRQVHERIEPPPVSDGTVLGVLKKLLILDGERISYRALDVEQIGSVYETMMGFRLERAAGPSLAMKSPKRHGAPSVVNLEELLAVSPRSRGRFVQDATDRKLTPRVLKAVAAADGVDRLHAALDPVVDRAATPDIAPAGSLLLQPNEERRRSGSHYTPRTLTRPIVRRTLEPVLARLRAAAGETAPRPEALLELKVCDPAMGSGAFLVEACRQLGDALLEAWRVHGGRPEIPPDEDETIFARRLVARKCLYGVDRNPLAVDLAKLSLWLVTLAKDHPLTFVDHAFRAGDSLVGLSRKQIGAFDWKEGGGELVSAMTRKALKRVRELRGEIREAGEEVSDRERRELWKNAEVELASVRLYGDLVLAAFFGKGSAVARKRERLRLSKDVLGGDAEDHRSWVEELHDGDPPLTPFHWEIEFPEVFDRENPGFDAFIGNPPFLGGKRISTVQGTGYRDWLSHLHPGASRNTDLAAHFFRRAFGLIRNDGALGLVATNTIAQGDTRAGGLRWICEHGGEIYDATRRYRWPGPAAVVVSVVHIAKVKGAFAGAKRLDGARTERITAFLFPRGGHADPAGLRANKNKAFNGMFLRGMGFTFDDTDRKGVASSLADMDRLLAENPRNREVILPYIGGKEVNASPTHAHHRYAINFRDFPLRREETDALWRDADERQRREWLRVGIVPLDYPGPVAADWPELLEIVRQRVKPERDKARQKAHRERWWRYAATRPGLDAASSGLNRILAISQVTTHVAFAFLPAPRVYGHTLYILPFSRHSAFCSIQSRPHEVWARFFASSLEDRLRYTPSDCFETFPFPDRWESRPDFEAPGKAYHEHRAALMAANDEGLTKTYNRFHDPYEHDPGIRELRDLHAAMDRAVLAAYGWDDLPTACDFFPLHPDDDPDPTPSGPRTPRTKYRYRWPDPTHNEVLTRLMDLNAKRAAAEHEEATTR